MQPTSTYGRIPNLEQHINIDAAVVEAVDATDVCGCCGGHLVDWWPEGLEADGAVENLGVHLDEDLAFLPPRRTRRSFSSYSLLPHLHSPFLAPCLLKTSNYTGWMGAEQNEGLMRGTETKKLV